MRANWEKKIKKKDFVLDIGCWDGKKVLELSKKYKNVYGMDINNSKIDLADPKVKRKLKLGDVTKKIPFKRKFDWIILSEVLEHVLDDEKSLYNISKSLKKGGKLILTTPRSIKFFEFWYPAWFRWKFLGGQRHYHYAKEELFKKLNKNGLKIKEYYILGDLRWIFSRWVNIFLRYGLNMKNQIKCPKGKGFYDWAILAEKR